MTPDDLRPLLAADPFERFFVSAADGTTLDVTDPAQVSFPSDRVLQYEAKGRRVLVAMRHVVTVGFPSTGGDVSFLRAR